MVLDEEQAVWPRATEDETPEEVRVSEVDDVFVMLRVTWFCVSL